MFKCLTAIGENPCNNRIHVSCTGYDPYIVPYLSIFICSECTARDQALQQKMLEVAAAAHEAFKMQKAKDQKGTNEELKSVAEKMGLLLKARSNQVSEQRQEIDRQNQEIQRQAEEIKQLQEKFSKLEPDRHTKILP